MSKVVCIGDERKEEVKFDFFFKEIDDAIIRIEFFILVFEILVKNLVFLYFDLIHLANIILSFNECKFFVDGGINMFF